MKRKLTDQDKIDIVRKYLESNISTRKLGAEYSVTHKAITGILKVRGVEIRKAGRVG